MRLTDYVSLKRPQLFFMAFAGSLFLLSNLGQAKELVIASGNFAPYFKQQNIAGQGYFDRVVLRALNLAGFKEFKVIPLDNPAIDRYFISANADVAINWTSMVPPANTFPSKYRTRFMNRVIMHNSIWAQNLNSLADLQGLKVASFPGATHLFGAKFTAATTNHFNSYYETTDQHALNKQLLSNKIDVRAGDYLMFYWYVNNYSNHDAKDFIIQDMLSYNGSYIVFQSKQLRDEFDKAMAELIASGEFAKITQQWLADYQLPNTQHQFFLVE